MIVSASRRADVPAFHAGWLKERLAEGFADVANPFRPSQVRRVDLRPPPEGGMDALALWTRDPRPLLDELPAWERRGIFTIWLVTVTGYPRELEPRTPETEAALDAVERLSALVGRDRVAWRYDPILANRAMDRAFHAGNFANLARRLAPWVHHATTSLLDDYPASRRRLDRAGIEHDPAEALEAAKAVAGAAQREGLLLCSCCEDLAGAGIAPGACIDGRWLDALRNLGLGDARDPGQRPGCRCAPSADIGAYDTCGHGCLYCYATKKTPPGEGR